MNFFKRQAKKTKAGQGAEEHPEQDGKVETDEREDAAVASSDEEVLQRLLEESNRDRELDGTFGSGDEDEDGEDAFEDQDEDLHEAGITDGLRPMKYESSLRGTRPRRIAPRVIDAPTNRRPSREEAAETRLSILRQQLAAEPQPEEEPDSPMALVGGQDHETSGEADGLADMDPVVAEDRGEDVPRTAEVHPLMPVLSPATPNEDPYSDQDLDDDPFADQDLHSGEDLSDACIAGDEDANMFTPDAEEAPEPLSAEEDTAPEDPVLDEFSESTPVDISKPEPMEPFRMADPEPVTAPNAVPSPHAVEELVAEAKSAEPEEQAPAEVNVQADLVQVPTPSAGRSGRRAGRVKTRLLGFDHSDGTSSDPFSSDAAAPGRTEATFPVGWIVVVDGPGRGASFTLLNGVSQIGRGTDQAIALDFGDNSISRSNHAVVAFDEEQKSFFIGHGGKANIVRLNDKPVLSTEELSNGDLVRLGETTLRFVALCGDDFDWGETSTRGGDDAAIA